MGRSAAFVVFVCLAIGIALALACGDDDDDSTGDSGDDDAGEEIPNATVTVDDATSANPLSRTVRVTTDRACSLSGIVTAENEFGYGPSVPEASDEGTEHVFVFYGLLESTTFAYAFYLAGDPGSVVATGTFDTEALPEEQPVVTGADIDDTSGGTDWYAVWTIDALTWGGTTYNFTVIYDRYARIRFYHRNEDNHSGWIQPRDDGSIAFTNNVEIRSLTPDGTESVMFDIQPTGSYYTATDHEFYIEDEYATAPMVLYNEVGTGVDCDLETPTDNMIGDGVLRLDADGVETWRWSLFDHTDVISPTEMDEANCDLRYWGRNYAYWSHFNSVVPVPDQDAILISSRNLFRLIKVDTNTGEILWQMGPPKGDFTGDFTWVGQPGEAEADYWFRMSHDVKYLSPTRLLLFDNGVCRYQDFCLIGSWSRALEIEIDEDAKTVEKVWEYRVGFAANQGNVQRHENGNTLIGSGGGGEVVEIASDGVEVFHMTFGTGTIRALYYPSPWVYETPPVSN